MGLPDPHSQEAWGPLTVPLWVMGFTPSTALLPVHPQAPLSSAWPYLLTREDPLKLTPEALNTPLHLECYLINVCITLLGLS